jgi:hypothetical protein
MKYDDARPLICEGDLILTTHTRARSWYDIKVWIVRIFTASKFSHACTVWKPRGTDRLMVIESVMPTVRDTPLADLAAGDGFYWIPLGVPYSDTELKFATDQIGRGRYSQWLAVWAQVLRIVDFVFGTNYKINVKNTDFLECALLVARQRLLSGVDLGDEYTPPAVADVALDRPGAALYHVTL